MATERKPEFFAGKNIRIGIIGCGYVGVASGLALRRDWPSSHRLRHRSQKMEKLNAGKIYIQHIPADKIAEHVKRRPLRRHHRFHEDSRNGCGADLRAHAARRAPRARSELRGADCAFHWPQSAARPTGRSGKHHLPGNHRRTRSADSGARRPEVPDHARTGIGKCRRRISSWRFRRSAKIPETSNSAWRRFPKS